MLTAIIAGQTDSTALAQLAKGRMRPKIAELERALKGYVQDNHRFLLRLHLEHIDDLNAKLVELEEEIGKQMPPFDDNDLLERLQTIPGVGPKVAQALVAEIGVDMSRFPTAGHLASWAGLVPGKNESGGRTHSARINKANRYLKAVLVEAANAVGHTRDTHLATQYHRLAARRGKKRAAIAVAHSILVIAYHIIRRGTSYIDLGVNYLDERKAETVQHQLVKRLERLGFKVTLETQTKAA